MAVKRSYSKKPLSKKINVKASSPATAVVQLEDKIKALIKKDRQIVAKLKPEIKYLDTQHSAVTSVDVPWQFSITYPAIGNLESTRVGSYIQRPFLHMKGLIFAGPNNVSGGRVDIYVLMYRKQEQTPTGNYIDAVGGAGGYGPFIRQDALGGYSIASHRNFEFNKDWKVVKHKKYFCPPPIQSPSTIYANGTQPHFNVDIKVRLPTVKFGTTPTTTINDGMCQVLVLNDKGTGTTVAGTSGYLCYLTNRILYSDN